MAMVCVKSQHFCQSYEKNNYSLIVFSQSDDTILLIVDSHFWRLRENKTELVFDRQDFEASNSSEQWTEKNYVFAHPVYVSKTDKYIGIALFQAQNETRRVKYILNNLITDKSFEISTTPVVSKDTFAMITISFMEIILKELKTNQNPVYSPTVKQDLCLQYSIKII